MDMQYGPCIGVSRFDRWQRAQRLGLNPPAAVWAMLEEEGSSADCLWEGRV